MRYWFQHLAMGVLLSFCAASSVSACDCGYAGAPCKAFAATPFVFAGKVTKISSVFIKIPSGGGYQDSLVTFAVTRGYKGLKGEQWVEVVTGSGGGDCGYDFREGESYLVYVFAHAATGKLYSGICSRTRRLSEAGEDIDYFARKDDPAHGSGIEGWITEQSRGRDNVRTDSIGPLKGVRVKVSGKSGSWIVVTDENGRFQLWGLQPGRYRVSPEFAPKFVEDSRTVSVGLDSCEEIGFLATPPWRTRRE